MRRVELVRWRRAALDLGQVRLADRAPVLLLELAHDLELGDVPAEAAQNALDLAQEADLLTEGHIAISDLISRLAKPCQGAGQVRAEGWPRPPTVDSPCPAGTTGP